MGARKTGKNGGFVRTGMACLGAIGSFVYLANLGAGVVEVIPDGVPVFGNADEAFAAFLLIYCSSYLGIPVPGMPPPGKRNASSKRK